MGKSRTVIAAATIAAVASLEILEGCARDVAPPDAVLARLPAERFANPQIAEVTTQVSGGTIMDRTTLDRLRDRIAAEIGRRPGVTVETADRTSVPGSMNVKVLFTRYGNGNAFAGAVAGEFLGQMHIDAEILFVDTKSGDIVGNYLVSKNSSASSLGANITPADEVEIGFAKSVAALLDRKN